MNGQLQNWLKIVANKKAYKDALKETILSLHGYRSSFMRTEHVHETFQGKTVWDGDVEVFRLRDHPKAKRAYAWAHLDGPNDDQTRFVVVLEIPPVKNSRTAVQASIMADSKTPQS